MSQALAMRSMCTPVRVTQVRPRTSPRRHGWRRLRVGGRPQARFDGGQQPFDRLAAGRPEEVDGRDFAEPLAKPQQGRRRLPLVAARALAAPDRRLKAARLLGQRGVVGIARGGENASTAGVRQTLDEARFTDGRVPAPGHDLPPHPLEVLEGLVAPRQHVDGVLHRDRSKALEAPADLHPEVAGLGRDLVDEEEPPGIWGLRHIGL